MKIEEFIKGYTNHPVLFVGTGFSLRYLTNSFDWNGLLARICFELTNNKEAYLDIKAKYEKNNIYDYDRIAGEIEEIFEKMIQKKEKRNGKFKEINDIFYRNMAQNKKMSRFKIYITKLLSSVDIKKDKDIEIAELKRMKKNISSIITTNYDKLLENIFDFAPLIGNDILLSNPYGTLYKIHGCVSDPSEIIMTEKDYKNFNEKYELIRAQLLSLFIHNPIIFIGYSVSDPNIKNILRTIFSYVPPNSEIAQKIKNNFLLIEYLPNSDSSEIVEHDIDIGNQISIRVNKIKTDNYANIYSNIAKLVLKISVMDIRKVENAMHKIKSGGNIEVKVTEDLDKIKNGEMVLAIGSKETIRYEFLTKSEMMQDYFTILEEKNEKLIKLINKYPLQKNNWFPIYAFSKICTNIDNVDFYKEAQKYKIEILYELCIKNRANMVYYNTVSISNDTLISKTKKQSVLYYNFYEENISLKEMEKYLKEYESKNETFYRRLLCLYDYKKFS